LSADWIRLIDPLFARIDSRLKPYGFTCKEATNMPKSKIEHMRYAKTIALEEGLPGLYACTNRGEALAEYVASWALKPDFRGRLPSSFLAFLRKWCLDLPFEPIPAVAAFIEGRQHQQGRRADKAIAAYSRALTLDPTFTRAFMDRGNQWFQKKEYKKAIADFDQAEQLSKGTGVDIIYLFRGYALMQIGEYARALPDYDKYMLLWPRDVRVYLNRAKLFKLTKEYDKGIAELTNAIHSFPKHQIAYRARADLLVKTKRYDEALKDLTHLVEMRPKNAEYYVMRGAVHKLKGDFDKALADLDQGIQLKPKLEASYYERGEVFKHRKDYEQAITEYTRAIEVHPRFVRAYFERGKMYQHLNQHERAIADFEAALRLLPKMEATIGPWLERSKKHLVK
jgi:tetratricopeptide (TPR) repeat protein